MQRIQKTCANICCVYIKNGLNLRVPLEQFGMERKLLAAWIQRRKIVPKELKEVVYVSAKLSSGHSKHFLTKNA